MKQPHFGFTRHGFPVHLHTIDHHPSATRYQRFNRAVAVRVTSGVGSMTCAYIFGVIAVLGLPQAIGQSFQNGHFSPLPLVQWIAQTFLQLVLLSVIIVGQNVSAEASDARQEKTFEHTETIMDRVDEHTQGGIRAILDAVTAQGAALQAVAERAGGEPVGPDRRPGS